jgi:hypothetical protein
LLDHRDSPAAFERNHRADDAQHTERGKRADGSLFPNQIVRQEFAHDVPAACRF